MSTVTEKSTALETVLDLIDAINQEDFDKARTLLDDEMKFIGVLGSRDGGDAYIQDMGKMRLKYEIEKQFANGSDVCLFYKLEMGGKKIEGFALYEVKNSKVTSLKVIFDPRPFL